MLLVVHVPVPDRGNDACEGRVEELAWCIRRSEPRSEGLRFCMREGELKQQQPKGWSEPSYRPG